MREGKRKKGEREVKSNSRLRGKKEAKDKESGDSAKDQPRSTIHISRIYGDNSLRWGSWNLKSQKLT
jgi:hypothetical protein